MQWAFDENERNWPTFEDSLILWPGRSSFFRPNFVPKNQLLSNTDLRVDLQKIVLISLISEFISRYHEDQHGDHFSRNLCPKLRFSRSTRDITRDNLSGLDLISRFLVELSEFWRWTQKTPRRTKRSTFQLSLSKKKLYLHEKWRDQLFLNAKIEMNSPKSWASYIS